MDSGVTVVIYRKTHCGTKGDSLKIKSRIMSTVNMSQQPSGEPMNKDRGGRGAVLSSLLP